MTSFLLYLLEASLVLALLYAAYRLLLSKETFFGFNRFFLIAVLILSLLLPLLSFEFTAGDSGFINQQVTELGKVRNSYYISFENWSEDTLSSQDSEAFWWQQFWSQDIWQIIMALAALVYTIGFAYRMLRLGLGYVRLYGLKRKLVHTHFEGLKVVEIPTPMAPFSFLNTVFIPDSIEDETEYTQILAHEKVHIQQKHSIDLIFVQLVAAFLWFNPVVWLLLTSLKQTHEYIADKNMLRQGFSLVEYQSLLLRQLISNNSYGLVHNFNLSFIKRRIAMMSIKESGWAGKSKAVVAISFILLIGMIIAQSNAIVGPPAAEASDAPQGATLQMKFYIDEIPLSMGLQYSRVKRYMGEFKFMLDNGQEDNIHIGLDLVRKGKVVGHASQQLEENTAFEIKELLDNAEQEDYLVVDVIEGPSEAVRLYNFPIFRENKDWKKHQASDLPPPPVALYVDGAAVGSEVPLADLKRAKFEYVLSEFIDFGVLSRQAGNVKTTLLRNEKAVLSILDTEIKREATIQLKELLAVAKKGDTIMVQFGKPDGLRFGAKFLLQ